MIEEEDRDWSEDTNCDTCEGCGSVCFNCLQSEEHCKCSKPKFVECDDCEGCGHEL